MYDKTHLDNQYELFMIQYDLDHALCPKCGSKDHMSTLMGFALNMDNKEAYRNLNRTTCSNCGHVCTAHDRISVEQFKQQ